MISNQLSKIVYKLLRNIKIKIKVIIKEIGLDYR